LFAPRHFFSPSTEFSPDYVRLDTECSGTEFEQDTLSGVPGKEKLALQTLAKIVKVFCFPGIDQDPLAV
jgi:hypothetical protein